MLLFRFTANVFYDKIKLNKRDEKTIAYFNNMSVFCAVY